MLIFYSMYIIANVIVKKFFNPFGETQTYTQRNDPESTVFLNTGNSLLI